MTTDVEALAERLLNDLDVSDDDAIAAAFLIREQAERIQALEAKCAELAIHLKDMADEFVRVFPVYYYAEPWAHDRNVVLKRAREVIAAQAGSKEE